MKNLEMWGAANHSPDLDRWEKFKIQKIFYPHSWEDVAVKDLDHCQWGDLDQKLDYYRDQKLDFVAGFMVGNQFRQTSLIDPDFPEKFSTYARHFINRYPWMSDFTPIPEINHLAKNSYLYGQWYPQLTDGLYYLKALLLQCKATVLAMKEIRSVNPKARLIQTDELIEQEFIDRERKWLTFDLLCGRVDRSHPLHAYFLDQKIREEELEWFVENPCPPNVLGIKNNQTNQEVIFKDAWNRYHLPMIISEMSDEKAMTLAAHLRDEGINIEAIIIQDENPAVDFRNYKHDFIIQESRMSP